MSQSELVIDICFHVTACCATISTANIFRRRQSNLVLSAVPDSAQTRLLSSCDGLSHFVTTVWESAKKRVLSAPVWASGATSRSYCPARCFHLRRGLRHQGTRWALRSSLHRAAIAEKVPNLSRFHLKRRALEVFQREHFLRHEGDLGRCIVRDGAADQTPGLAVHHVVHHRLLKRCHGLHDERPARGRCVTILIQSPNFLMAYAHLWCVTLTDLGHGRLICCLGHNQDQVWKNTGMKKLHAHATWTIHITVQIEHRENTALSALPLHPKYLPHHGSCGRIHDPTQGESGMQHLKLALMLQILARCSPLPHAALRHQTTVELTLITHAHGPMLCHAIKQGASVFHATPFAKSG